MTFALLGVVAMQLYFLSQSYNLQSKLFDHSVKEALANVVARLTKQDADNFLRQRILREQQAASSKDIPELADIETSNKPILVKDSVKTKGEPTKRERR